MSRYMKGRRGMLCLLLAAISSCMLTAAAAGQETEILPEEFPIWFFHDTACGTCDGTEEFLQIVSEEISAYRELYPYELNMFNVFKSDGYASMQSVLEEQELSPEGIAFPAMLINGKIYEGLDMIEASLKQEYVSAVGSSAVYFYRTDCQECIDTEPFIDSLPETVCVEGTELPFYMTCLNSREGDNGTLIREMFVEYEVSEEDQMVPFVFLADTYLAGKEAIEGQLMELLKQGHGRKTDIKSDKESETGTESDQLQNRK